MRILKIFGAAFGGIVFGLLCFCLLMLSSEGILNHVIIFLSILLSVISGLAVAFGLYSF